MDNWVSYYTRWIAHYKKYRQLRSEADGYNETSTTPAVLSMVFRKGVGAI